MKKSFKNKTVEDFGNQWQIHGELRDNHWTSDEMFRDHFPKNFDLSILSGAKVLEIGSGSGRILHMISRYNPKELIGIEPSNGFSNLVRNTSKLKNLKLINVRGSEFDEKNLDVIISLGVIHHIPGAREVVVNAYNSLRKNGYFIMWVYGKENNQPYVFFQSIFRKVTKILPDKLLDPISLLISYIFDSYGLISKIFFANKLPLSGYYLRVFSKCGRREKKYIIFDQLNPTYSKYYTEKEVLDLLNFAGFKEIEIYHRHGYSWTAIAKK